MDYASAFVQTSGRFELTDIAMRELFGEVRDGEHTISAFVRDGSQYSIARDRLFFLQSEKPSIPVIKTAMQLSSGAFLQWSRPDTSVSYDVFAIAMGEQPRKLLSNISSDSTVLEMIPGEYDLSVEAVSTAGLRTRSKSVRVRVVA